MNLSSLARSPALHTPCHSYTHSHICSGSHICSWIQQAKCGAIWIDLHSGELAYNLTARVNVAHIYIRMYIFTWHDHLHLYTQTHTPLFLSMDASHLIHVDFLVKIIKMTSLRPPPHPQHSPPSPPFLQLSELFVSPCLRNQYPLIPGMHLAVSFRILVKNHDTYRCRIQHHFQNVAQWPGQLTRLISC